MDLNRTPAQIADAAAEELRALNHRTIGTGDDWQYPGDVYSVAGNLSAMAMRLPQVLDQMKVLVDGLAGSGKLHSDRGTLHIDLADTYTGLEEGQQAAALLYEALNRVHQALGPVAYKE